MVKIVKILPHHNNGDPQYGEPFFWGLGNDGEIYFQVLYNEDKKFSDTEWLITNEQT